MPARRSRSSTKGKAPSHPPPSPRPETLPLNKLFGQVYSYTDELGFTKSFGGGSWYELGTPRPPSAREELDAAIAAATQRAADAERYRVEIQKRQEGAQKAAKNKRQRTEDFCRALEVLRQDKPRLSYPAAVRILLLMPAMTPSSKSKETWAELLKVDKASVDAIDRLVRRVGEARRKNRPAK